MALNPTDACGLMDPSIPQWKRELIIRRRAIGRTLQVGGSSVRLTCPAVVAVVRQPEVVGDSDNIIKCQDHRLPTCDETTSTQSSLNQTRVGSRPHSTHSAVPVGNMRLLDGCGEVDNIVLNGNGVDVKNKQSDIVSSDLSGNYKLIMGEDKSLTLKNKNVTARSKLDYKKMSVIKQQTMLLENLSNDEVKGHSLKDEDCLSDSSEELQYGPGIVNKLKTKYLSWTLRERKHVARPSIVNLRRAASLENMLENDEELNKPNAPRSVAETNGKTENVTLNSYKNSNVSRGLPPHHTIKFTGNRTIETMKRARSMDTLLKSESKTGKNISNGERKGNLNREIPRCNGKPIASIVNENLIIVENQSLVSPKIVLRENDESSKNIVNNVGHCTQANRELPPPDLVKQTLKIFEVSPKKSTKMHIPRNLNKSNPGVDNSIGKTLSSVNNIKSIDKSKASVKPSLSPKPVLSPEKLRQNKLRQGSPKKILFSQNPAPLTPPSIIEQVSRQPEVIEPTVKESCLEKVNCLSPTKSVNPRSISPIVTVISNRETILPVTTASNITPTKVSNSSTVKDDVLSDMDDLQEVDGYETSKQVPESALENIRLGGVSMQFSFKNENQLHDAASKSHLPQPRRPPQALNTSLLKQSLEKSPPVANIAPMGSPSSPQTKQIGIIRPLVSSKVQTPRTPPILTEQEIEKNLINRVKSIEQPISKVVVSIKSLPENVLLGSVPDVSENKSLTLPRVCANPKTRTQGLWDDKLWQQNQNTIVFNFSGRKDIPDYIENDGLILKGKKDRPRPGEGGIILLDGAAEDSSTDPDPEELTSTDPPSPCDVTFEGDNVIINGRSNLKKSPKQVKLRIKFNDEATTMFEYPSEASLVDEERAPTPASEPDGVEEHSPASCSSTQPAPTAGLAKVPIGGSLGAYTPRQFGAGDWQLGVTPVHTPASAAPTQPSAEEDHLKPAPPESTVVWSEDTASDLLF